MAGFTPEWARHAVWYQILPERFANGQRSDDPTPASLDGSQHAGARTPAELTKTMEPRAFRSSGKPDCTT